MSELTEKEFFETYKLDVYKTCFYMLHNHQDAEDICQEVFIKAIQSGYESINKPKAWLLTITLNMCKNHLKKRKKIVLMDRFKQLVDPLNVTDQYESKEVKSELQTALLNLPAGIRSVLVLKYLNEMKNEQVAQILNIPLGTVKSRCKKRLQNMRQFIMANDSTTADLTGGLPHV